MLAFDYFLIKMAKNKQNKRNIAQELSLLERKRAEMDALVRLTSLKQGLYLSEKKASLLAEQKDRLEFRRKKLEEEYGIKEIELRIDVFKNMLSILEKSESDL